MATLTLDTLKRNDLKGALAVAEAELTAGTYGQETAEILFMLQDEPDALVKALGDLVEKHRKDVKAKKR